jgi:small conductance mechanosensitive channel
MDQEIEIAGFSLDWAELSETIQTTGVEFAINLLAATAIFLAGRVVARLLTRGLRSLMQRQKADPILETFVCNLVYWALMAFVIIAAITKLGVQTASLIALIGAAGLAVGLAMQGSLANFAAGVLIVMFRPYRVGDWIEAAGIAGTVEEVQILTTTLKTADNKRITVPNGQIMDSIITNYSANSTRRIDLVVGVSYDDDIDKVRETLKASTSIDSSLIPGWCERSVRRCCCSSQRRRKCWAGLELGVVPIAPMLASLSGLPVVFVRKTAKSYGTCHLAEGAPVAGRTLLVVEDVVTSGDR